MNQNEPDSPPFQFTLSGLLIVITAIAVCLPMVARRPILVQILINTGGMLVAWAVFLVFARAARGQSRLTNVLLVAAAIALVSAVLAAAAYFNSKIASISTAMLPGSEPIPTALRAPTPSSGPKTSDISSL
jgi:hypothetical protein